MSVQIMKWKQNNAYMEKYCNKFERTITGPAKRNQIRPDLVMTPDFIEEKSNSNVKKMTGGALKIPNIIVSNDDSLCLLNNQSCYYESRSESVVDSINSDSKSKLEGEGIESKIVSDKKSGPEGCEKS